MKRVLQNLDLELLLLLTALTNRRQLQSALASYLSNAEDKFRYELVETLVGITTLAERLDIKSACS